MPKLTNFPILHGHFTDEEVSCTCIENYVVLQALYQCLQLLQEIHLQGLGIQLSTIENIHYY